jgi:hypothetical protein
LDCMPVSILGFLRVRQRVPKAFHSSDVLPNRVCNLYRCTILDNIRDGNLCILNFLDKLWSDIRLRWGFLRFQNLLFPNSFFDRFVSGLNMLRFYS